MMDCDCGIMFNDVGGDGVMIDAGPPIPVGVGALRDENRFGVDSVTAFSPAPTSLTSLGWCSHVRCDPLVDT